MSTWWDAIHRRYDKYVKYQNKYGDIIEEMETLRVLNRDYYAKRECEVTKDYKRNRVDIIRRIQANSDRYVSEYEP